VDVRVFCGGGGLSFISEFVRDHPNYSREDQVARVMNSIVTLLTRLSPLDQLKLTSRWKEEEKTALVSYFINRSTESICSKVLLLFRLHVHSTSCQLMPCAVQMRTVISYIHNSSAHRSKDRIEVQARSL